MKAPIAGGLPSPVGCIPGLSVNPKVELPPPFLPLLFSDAISSETEWVDPIADCWGGFSCTEGPFPEADMVVGDVAVAEDAVRQSFSNGIIEGTVSVLEDDGGTKPALKLGELTVRCFFEAGGC